MSVSLVVKLDGVEHAVTMEQWYELRRDVQSQIEMLKVKCPTCRCRLLPDADCSCCSQWRGE